MVPGLGTAIGFVVGAIADSLIHVGQGPQRAAQSAAITNALTAAGFADVERRLELGIFSEYRARKPPNP